MQLASNNKYMKNIQKAFLYDLIALWDWKRSRLPEPVNLKTCTNIYPTNKGWDSTNEYYFSDY